MSTHYQECQGTTGVGTLQPFETDPFKHEKTSQYLQKFESVRGDVHNSAGGKQVFGQQPSHCPKCIGVGVGIGFGLVL